MPLSANIYEATNIESNSMQLNGELTDLGGYDLALCYFEYGQQSDLSDAVKSTRAILMNQVGGYSLLQENMDDNKDYYYRAAAQNYEGTIEQNRFLSQSIELGSQENLSLILNDKNVFTKSFFGNDISYSIFSKKEFLIQFWTGEITSINDGNVRVKAYDSSNRMTKKIQTVGEVDFSKINSIKIDWKNVGHDSGNNETYLSIETSSGSINKLFRKGRFDEREITTIDVSDINDYGAISITARDDDYKTKSYEASSDIYIYGIWGE